MAHGVVVASQEGEIIFTNPSFDRLFGYDPDELLGQHVSALIQGQSEECSTTATTLLSRLRTQGVWQGEICNCQKDGTPFTTLAYITVFEMDGGQYYVGVQVDRTERNRLEAQVYERERLALIGMIAVSMSHEIGNRLNSLSSSVQLLERSLTNSPALARNDQAEIVQDINTETARLEEVLQALRELSIPHRFALRPVDVSQLVTAVLQARYSRCARQKIRQIRSFPASLPWVVADQEQLTYVLAKLCDNAIDAMPSGGTLTVGTAATIDTLSLTVHDTGTCLAEGLDPFEPFLTTRVGRSGVGLAVVKHLVLSQGGTIQHASTPQTGTTFTIQLSRASRPPSQTNGNTPSSRFPEESTPRRHKRRLHRAEGGPG